jgi:hypothetical protein
MFTSTAALLEAMKVRLEAFVPPGEVAGDDSKFRVRCEEAEVLTGPRTVELTAFGGRFPERKMHGPDWETQVVLKLLSPNVPSEPGEYTAHQRCLVDSEELLIDLRTWAGANDVTIIPELAEIRTDGNGYLESTRVLTVTFKRG